MLKSRPFRPFIVETTDGESFRVEDPDYARVNPIDTEVFVFDKRGHLHRALVQRIVKLRRWRKGPARRPKR